MVALACFFLLGMPEQQSLERFPPLPVVDAQIRAADAYLFWLGARLHFLTWDLDALREQETACRNARAAWCALRGAWAADHDAARRYHLDDLLARVGPGAYFAGAMPRCLPFTVANQ